MANEKKKTPFDLTGCGHLDERGVLRLHNVRRQDGGAVSVEAQSPADHASTGATSDAYRDGWDRAFGRGSGGEVN